MRYEILMLAIPEITVDESAKLEAQLRDLITQNRGTLLSFERWGKYKLAYPIQRNEYGVYFLARFEGAQEVAQQLLEALRTLLTLKYSEVVMRFLINRLSMRHSLEYQRPESLEDIPSKGAEGSSREARIDHESESTGGRSFRTHLSSHEGAL